MAFTKRTGLFLLVVVAAVAGTVFYFQVDPAGSLLIPKCPFRLLTGWDCPGCGSQRTMHALLHGRIREAFTYNPLLVVSFPYLGVVSFLEFFNGKYRYPWLRKALMGQTACILIFCLITLYWIGRNIL